MKLYSVKDYLTGIKRNDKIWISRALSLIEGRRIEQRDLSCQLISSLEKSLEKKSGKIIGVSGTPGVGKSTFIDGLGYHLTEDLKLRVAVLAVDPSSIRSGGSVLGDKTRMQMLASSDLSFIRPVALSGFTGGVHPRVREMSLVLKAAGYDYVFIESVGVGQAEFDLYWMVDFFLLLIGPNEGDAIQGIKRGILEFAHHIIVHKADEISKGEASITASQYQSSLQILRSGDDFIPKVQLLSTLDALKKKKMGEVWAILQDCMKDYWKSSFFQSSLSESLKQQLESKLKLDTIEMIMESSVFEKMREKALKELSFGKKLPGSISYESVKKLFQEKNLG